MSDDRFLQIPVSPSSLGAFISDLLGQRREISKEYSNVFEIKHENLVQIDELIMQRIEGQNYSTLVSFRCEYIFENGIKVKFESRESVRAHNDLRQLKSVGLIMKYVFLINFPNTATPEKQEIRLTARSSTISEKKWMETLEDLSIRILATLRHWNWR